MGACASTPAPAVPKPSKRLDENLSRVLDGDAAAAPAPAGDAADAKPAAGPVTAPVRVFRDNQELGVKLGANESGSIQFTVTDTLVEAREAAQAFHASYTAQGDLRSLENLKLLLSMGIEVRYCSSNPFIGRLRLRFLSIDGAKNAEATYIKVRMAKDRTVPLFAAAGDGESVTFPDRPLFFVVVHSDAVATIKVRNKKEGALFYGQARLAVKDLQTGTYVRELAMTDPRDASRAVATVKVEVDYSYMRGTTDEGTYHHPSRVMINKRKLRTLVGLTAASSLVRHISQQNHWLLSHDNVWPPSSTFSDAEEERRKEAEQNSRDAAAEQQLQGPARALITHSASDLRGNTPAERYSAAVAEARATGGARSHASAVMTQGTLLEALGPQEGDSEELAGFKGQMLALMLAMHERLERTEDVQEQQDIALQEVLKQVAEARAGRPPARASLELSGQAGEPFVSGTFEYGLGRPAAGVKTYLFVNKAQDERAPHEAMVQFLGVFRTSKKGQLNGIPVPEHVWRTPGHYSIVALLPEDNTYAKGSLFILAPGTKCVIFDMDGTITVGDIGVVTQFAIDSLAASTAAAQNLSHKYDIQARHSALTCVRAWAAKGYQPIYVSGRQGSYYNLTMEWLVKHDYPPGPIHLTRTHLPTLPIYYSVGNFKVEYMEGLKAKGLELFAAYGNTTTDIRAYVASGIPLERVFVIGPHGGKGGSVKVDNFTDHLPAIFDLPDADPPIPYTELLFTAVPGYKHRRPAVARPDGAAVRSDSLASTLSSGVSDSVYSSQDIGDGAEAADDDIDEDYEAEVEAQRAEALGREDPPAGAGV